MDPVSQHLPGCEAGVFERDLAFAFMETSEDW